MALVEEALIIGRGLLQMEVAGVGIDEGEAGGEDIVEAYDMWPNISCYIIVKTTIRYESV